MPEVFDFDVFLSHSSKDKPAVRALAERLRNDGLRVWLDESEIKPGDMIGLQVENGLERSRTLVLAMSKNAFSSDWVSLERHTVMFRDPTNSRRRFVPVLLEQCRIPDSLRQFAYVDWQRLDESEYQKLLAACSPRHIERRETQPEEVSKNFHRVLSDSCLTVVVTPDERHIVAGLLGQAAITTMAITPGLVLEAVHQATMVSTAEKIREDWVRSISISPDGTRGHFVSRKELISFRLVPGSSSKPTGVKGVPSDVHGITEMTPTRLATGSGEGLFFVDLKSKITSRVSEKEVFSLAVNKRRGWVAIGHGDGSIDCLSLDFEPIKQFSGAHARRIYSLAFIDRPGQLASASDDGTVCIWDMTKSHPLAVLEGHRGTIYTLLPLPDRESLASGGEDQTLRIWALDSGKCIQTIKAPGWVYGIALIKRSKTLLCATSTGLFAYPLALISSSTQTQRDVTRYADVTRYTNAKVLFVGDTGVGKSGLTTRLANGEFSPTESTDAAWVTTAPLNSKSSTNKTQREIWMWDFAGQADYRLMHQLFLSDASLAVLVFNPQSDNPFDGLGQWERDIRKGGGEDVSKLLVAGRIDRGGLMVSRKLVDEFVKQRGFAKYIETSAKTGQGCDELKAAIARAIPWRNIPWRTSPDIFKILKDAIVRLRDNAINATGPNVLHMAALKQQLDLEIPEEKYSLEELKAVVNLLAGRGIAWTLGFGDYVLLRPELLAVYGGALVRSVRDHVDEIGVIDEARFLMGKLNYADATRAERADEEIILQALHHLLIARAFCLREQTSNGPILIFPSYFKRERPELDNHPGVLVTYRISGNLEEIYTTMVVRLHHTKAFEKDRLWRFAADFKTPEGKRLGLKMTRKGEGNGELSVYAQHDVPEDTKVIFIRYVHEHVLSKEPESVRIRHYACGGCGEPVLNHDTVTQKRTAGKKDIVCVKCEKRILFEDLIERKFASQTIMERTFEEQRTSRERLDNESKEMLLISHAYAVSAQAGHVFRQLKEFDHGIDGEIEFKTPDGVASGRKLYLQLKSGDSYLQAALSGREVFRLKARHAEYWTQQPCDVMLVVRGSNGTVRWMNITVRLRELIEQGKPTPRQIDFLGEQFDEASLRRLADRILQ